MAERPRKRRRIEAPAEDVLELSSGQETQDLPPLSTDALITLFLWLSHADLVHVAAVCMEFAVAAGETYRLRRIRWPHKCVAPDLRLGHSSAVGGFTIPQMDAALDAKRFANLTAINGAAMAGNRPLLSHLLNVRKVRPVLPCALAAAAESGSTIVFDMIVAHLDDKYRPYIYSGCAVKTAGRVGATEILERIGSYLCMDKRACLGGHTQSSITYVAALSAAEHGCVKTVKWVSFRPNMTGTFVDVINTAVRHGQIPVLAHLASRWYSMIYHPHTRQDAQEAGQTAVVEWLDSTWDASGRRSFEASSQVLHYLLQGDRARALRYVDLDPRVNELPWRLIENGRPDLLPWCYEHALPIPSTSGLYQHCIEHGSLVAARTLHDLGVPIYPNVWYLAVRHRLSLEWLQWMDSVIPLHSLNNYDYSVFYDVLMTMTPEERAPYAQASHMPAILPRDSFS